MVEINYLTWMFSVNVTLCKHNLANLFTIEDGGIIRLDFFI
jgi:hypothetical protein